MKKITFLLVFAYSAAFLIWQKTPSTPSFFSKNKNVKKEATNEQEDNPSLPDDWFQAQRNYPNTDIDYNYVTAQLREVAAQRTAAAKNLRGNPWEQAGPFNIGGRISDVAMPSDDVNTIYVGAASGGVFKTTDQGDTWKSLFDDATTQSIGDIEIAPSDNKTLYVGTGEPNAGGGSLTYEGTGIYTSANAGATWKNIGLSEGRICAKIAIDPKDKKRVFAAMMGNLFKNNADRGIYRTTDGGTSWKKILFLSDSTGGCDVKIHPTNPKIIFAGMWERVRRVNFRKYYGPTSGLYRSIDGGDTWEKVSGGLPDGDISRVYVTFAPSNPQTMYCKMLTGDGGGNYFLKGNFKSIDGGANWTALPQPVLSSQFFTYWFGGIVVSPSDEKELYFPDFVLGHSTDGGMSWEELPIDHVDEHSVVLHPLDPKLVVVGSDGGLFISHDKGAFFEHNTKLPISQLYTSEISYTDPTRLYAGLQDNGTNVNNSTLDSWTSIYGGDGLVVKEDPINPQYIYLEYQYGGFSFGQVPTNNNRFNWKTPIVLNPQRPSTVYVASQYVYKSFNHGGNFVQISPDLSKQKVGSTGITYASVTSLAVAPVDSNYIYAGTDDGNVWVTKNNGLDWKKINTTDLPQRWVTSIAVHPTDPKKVYVTFSGYRYGDQKGHVFYSADAGATWTSIMGNLLDFPVNDLEIDLDQPSTLYVATDVGVYVTYNNGKQWTWFSEGMPITVCTDLTFHRPTRSLVIATYGRSMYRRQLPPIVAVQEEVTTSRNLRVYPSIFYQNIQLETNFATTTEGLIEIWTLNGQKTHTIPAQSFQTGKTTLTLDGSAWSGGTYLVRLVTKSGTTVQKVVRL